MKTTKALLDYLATCPKSCLESFELARLNERANLRKQMMEIIDEWVETDIQARIAEWVLIHRREQASKQAARSLPAPVETTQVPLFSAKSAGELPALSSNPVIPAFRSAVPDGVTPSPRGCISLHNRTPRERSSRILRADRLCREKRVRIA